MSLASLPDVLIAHLCTYLEYDDVCNLMETSKKNYNAIKAYKRDKIKVDYLRFVDPSCSKSHVSEMFVAQMDKKNGDRAKRFSFKLFSADNSLSENLRNVLNECSSVDTIRFLGCDLTSDISDVLLKTKAKIEHIRVVIGKIIMSGKEFVAVCRKFKGSEFDCYWPSFNSEILSDDVLVPALQALTEIRVAGDVEAMNTVEIITDRTLKALLEGDSNPKYFGLSAFHKSFTIKKIVNLLKNLKERNSKGLNYQLGFLQSDQLIDAERYFNGDTGELKK